MKLILASTSKFKSEILDKVGMKHSNMNGNYNEVSLDTNNVSICDLQSLIHSFTLSNDSLLVTSYTTKAHTLFL